MSYTSLRSFFLLLFGAILGPLSVYGMGSHFIENYTDSPVNLGGQTWSVSTYNNDWIFFANKNGLYQFNGNSWAIATMHNGADVRSVFASPKTKRVYVGGINEFGYVTPDDHGCLRYTCLSDSIGKNKYIGNIWGIYKTEGGVYTQGDHDVLISEGSKSTVVHGNDKLNCSNLVNSVLYLGTDNGLKVLIGRKIVQAYGAENLKSARVRQILPYKDGILVVTSSSGVYYYDGSATTRLSIDPAWQSRLTDIFCGAVRDNTLALGTVLNGLYIIDLTTGNVNHYSQDNGMQNNTVLSLAFDSEGNLWAGLDRGIDRLRLSLPVTDLFAHSSNIGAGYVAQIIDGRLYFGTNRGLYSAPYNKSATNFDASMLGNMSGQVWNIQKVGDDIFCLHDRGLFLLQNGVAKQLDVTNGAWLVQPFISDPTRAYVGTYDGISVIQKTADGWHTVKVIDNCYVSAFSFVLEDDYTIWYVNPRTDVVRMRLDPKSYKIVARTHYNKDKGLPVTQDVNVYKIDNAIIFTTQNGIFRYDKASNRIVRDTLLNSRLENRQGILSIQSRGKYLYALTAKELLRSDGHHISSLPMMPMKARSFHPAHLFTVVNDSTVVLPNHMGYSVFHFGALPHCIKPSPQYGRINRMSLTELGDSVIFISNFLQHKPKIEIPYSNNSVKIDFGVPPQDNSFVEGYKYRLNGGPWSELTPSNFKEYTGLSNDDYTFEVVTITSDGQTISDSIDFTILPPWYLTVWAKIVYLLLIIVAIWMLYRLTNKRVARAARLAELRKDAEIKRKDQEIHALEKQKLQGEIEHKSQEIVNLLLSVSSKNEALINIKEELQSIRANLKGDPTNRKSLTALQEQIDTALQSEKILDRIEKEFDLVHNDFTKKLRADYPDLSANEIKICSYIKMNLSTKEIAPLMNMSLRGVETIRYRMRKKFALDRSDSLTEFIRNF